MRKYTVLTAMLLTTATVVVSPAVTWTIEQVTDNTEPDYGASATAVSSGLMLVYIHIDTDGGGGNLDKEVFFADNFSGSWSTSRITDNSQDDVAYVIAANYNEQTAHMMILWQDILGNEISYCTGTPENWIFQQVTNDTINDKYPTLAIDADGYIHVTYHRNDTTGDMEIFYANNITGSWISEQVTDNGTQDKNPMIALDSEDNPNVVYVNASDILYTKKISGIWTTPVLVTGGVDFAPIFVLDSDDNCHMVYSKSFAADAEIYYANNVYGSWQEIVVTANDYHDLFPKIFVDPNQKVHIVYTAQEDDTDSEIFYANNVSDVWTFERVTDNDAEEQGGWLVVDNDSIGHIFLTSDSDGGEEIYHAYSNQPLFGDVDDFVAENAQISTPIFINLDKSVFSSQATVNYSLPKAGNVSLKIYDATGSLVKTLVEDASKSGEYRVVWDRVSDDGTHAAPGVYFWQLTADGEQASVKSVLK